MSVVSLDLDSGELPESFSLTQKDTRKEFELAIVRVEA